MIRPIYAAAILLSTNRLAWAQTPPVPTPPPATQPAVPPQATPPTVVTPPPTAVSTVPAPPIAPVAVRGTRVTITPPMDFALAESFPGFVQKSSGASIILVELPGSFDKVSAGFTMPKEMAKRGMTLMNRYPITISGQNGSLMQIRQTLAGTVYEKWVVAVGNSKESLLVTAVYPESTAKELSQPLKDAVLSTVWQVDRSVTVTEGIAFTVVPSGGLKMAKRVMNNLIYTKDGVFPSKSPDTPVYVVGPALSEAAIPVTMRESVARKVVASQMKSDHIVYSQPKSLTIDGLPGLEIIARAVERNTKAIVVVHETVLFSDNGLYLLIGMVSQRTADRYLPIFDTMAKTFKRRR